MNRTATAAAALFGAWSPATILNPRPTLTSWESHGELMDEARLAAPATSDDIIQAVNSAPGSSWKAGRNVRFEGATLKDAKLLMGTKQNTDPETFLPYKPLEKTVELPAEFDWRTDPRAANCPSVKEVRDQANCGSCWAFGSVEAMSDRICIASNGTDRSHLSAEHVVSCCHLLDMGCNGGIPATVYHYYHYDGIVTGGNYGDKSMCYSYQLEPCAHHSVSPKYANCSGEVPAPKCANKCIDNGADWDGDKRFGAGGHSVCGLFSSCPDNMMQEIYQHGPITGMFFVHQSFISYKSGVYESLGLLDPMLGGHAIKILGWGNEANKPYWLVANSWNEEWGDHGFFKIVRGKNEGNIESVLLDGGPVAGMPKASTVSHLVV